MQSKEQIESALQILLKSVKGSELSGKKAQALTNAGMAMCLAWVLKVDGVTEQFDAMMAACLAMDKKRGHRHA